MFLIFRNFNKLASSNKQHNDQDEPDKIEVKFKLQFTCCHRLLGRINLNLYRGL